MLKFSANRAQDTPVALTPDEDRKLRLAFGRFADNRHRQAGEDVVSAHYEKKRCFHCDCRPDYYRLKERLNHRLATQRGRSLNYVQRYGLINLHNHSKTTRRRPYGLFIGTFDRIENKILYP